METKEEQQKRYLATTMGIAYCTIQTVNIYVSIHELLVAGQVGYFCWVAIIFLIDKTISFFVLRREKFGYEIVTLDILNLGFVSIFLKRYPPFYRPMYGAKLFCVIIPTVTVQMVFFFGLDMVDDTKDKLFQILMFFTYIGYQILQIRCFLALRMEAKNSFKELSSMILIYTLNVFSNYGIWLVFSSHRDSILNISLLFYGVLLFIGMVGYQSYSLYRLKSSTLLLNFLYNIITSTNYTTEYKYYFHHYNDHFEDLYRERQNDLLIMSLYKSAQLLIYLYLGDIKHYKDKYMLLNYMSNAMVIVTFLDILSNMIQFIFGVRRVFYALVTSKLVGEKHIAKHIMTQIPSNKKFIHINNKTSGDAVSNHNQNEDNHQIEMMSLVDSLDSLSSSGKKKQRYPLLSRKIDNVTAQAFLSHLAKLQQEGGCLLVEEPKLSICSQKFEVSNYVNFAQLSIFFAYAEIIPSKTFDIQADWENIYMFRLLSRGYDKKFRCVDETYTYCVHNYLDIFLPMLTLHKHYTPYLFQQPSRLIMDLYLI